MTQAKTSRRLLLKGAGASAALAVAAPALAQGRGRASAAMDVDGAVQAAYARYRTLAEGKNADYIPALAKVPSTYFGIAVVTREGAVIGVISLGEILRRILPVADEAPAGS